MSAPVTGGAAAEAGPSFDAVVGSVEDALETLRKVCNGFCTMLYLCCSVYTCPNVCVPLPHCSFALY